MGLASRPTTPASPLEEIEGFGVEDCDVLEGDHISRTVTWRGRSDLSALEGRNLSLRFQLARAKLFSTALVAGDSRTLTIHQVRHLLAGGRLMNSGAFACVNFWRITLSGAVPGTLVIASHR